MSEPVEVAEARRDGESWSDMILRQKESGAKDGSPRELLRSLPDEQRQENGSKGRGEIVLDQPLMAEGTSYETLLNEYIARAAPQQEQAPDLER